MIEISHQSLDSAVKAILPLIIGYLAWQVHWCKQEVALLKDRVAATEREAKSAAIEVSRLASDIQSTWLAVQGHVLASKAKEK